MFVVFASCWVSSCLGLGKSLVKNQTASIKAIIVRSPTLKFLSWAIIGCLINCFNLGPIPNKMPNLSSLNFLSTPQTPLRIFLINQIVTSPKKVINLINQVKKTIIGKSVVFAAFCINLILAIDIAHSILKFLIWHGVKIYHFEMI